MAVINGTSGDDNLSDTQEDDIVYLLAGADSFYSNNGNDTVYGGEGDDFLGTYGGSDSLYGGDGNDFISGQRIYYHSDDTILLDGGAGDDQIAFEVSNGSVVTAFGGTGNDTFTFEGYGNQPVTLTADGGEGEDVFNIELSYLKYHLTLGADSDRIVLKYAYHGSEGIANTIVVSDFQAGASGDRLDFNYLLADGSDWNEISNPFVGGYVRVIQSGEDALVQFDIERDGVWTTTVTLKGVQASALGYQNLGYTVDGSPIPGVTWNGTADADQYSGGEYNDRLYGLGGADVLYGLMGDDVLVGGPQNDRLYGGDGDDILWGEGGDDTLVTGHGNDVVYGGGGNDTLRFETQGYYYTLAFTPLLDGGDGNDTFIVDMGGPHVVTMRGGAGADTFSAQMYSDGAVVIDGGADNDIVNIGSDGSYTVTLGTGRDTVRFVGYEPSAYFTTAAVITDFDTSAGGDKIDFTELWDHIRDVRPLSDNPFFGGFFRLVQVGADTQLQFREGGVSGEGDYITFAIFQNTNVAAFTIDNLGHNPDGSEAPGVVWTGTENADSFEGTAGTDTIAGLAGNDTLYGLSSADIIDGGAGDDFIDGGMGADRLSGGTGDDFIRDRGNGWGDDFIDGGDGNDTVEVSHYTNGAEENLFINLGFGNDALDLDTWTARNFVYAGGGNDNLILSAREDDVLIDAYGGGGNDTFRIFLWGGAYRLSLGAGQDVISISGQLQLDAYADNLVVTDFQLGTSGDRIDISEFLSNSYIQLNAWNPFYDPRVRLVQDGANALLQIDTSYGAGIYTTVAVFENVDTGVITGNFNFGGDPGTLRFTGTAGADNFIGLWGNSEMTGAEGDDTMDGRAGDDLLDGGTGNDYLLGAQGNDRLYGGDGNDLLDGGRGDDLLFGGEGNDKLYSWKGLNIMDGGAGDDLIVGGEDKDIAYGGTGMDTLRGHTGDDELHGGADNDVVEGSWGDDILYGDDGHDYINGQGHDDTLYGGLGGDTMRGEDGNDRIYGEAGGDDIDGGEHDDYLYGGDGNDTVKGGGGYDWLEGGAGDDLMMGGLGTDVLLGEAGLDTLYGGDDGDELWGGADADKLYGEGGNDLLDGGTGNDLLSGGAGVDILRGGLGNDTLTGGAETDVFIMEGALSAGNVDTITDFNAVQDGIILDLNVFKALSGEGVLAAGAFRQGSSAGDADDRIIYNQSTGEIFYDSDGNGAAAKVLFAKVTAGTVLSAANFEAYYTSGQGQFQSEGKGHAFAGEDFLTGADGAFF